MVQVRDFQELITYQNSLQHPDVGVCVFSKALLKVSCGCLTNENSLASLVRGKCREYQTRLHRKIHKINHFYKILASSPCENQTDEECGLQDLRIRMDRICAQYCHPYYYMYFIERIVTGLHSL